MMFNEAAIEDLDVKTFLGGVKWKIQNVESKNLQWDFFYKNNSSQD